LLKGSNALIPTKDLRYLASMASGISIVVEHSPHHPKIEDSSPAPGNKIAMKDLRCLAILASSDSTVVEHSPHHPKVEGLSPAPGDK
jgi:hypothetical protein